MKVYILIEWHDADTPTIVGVHADLQKAIEVGDALCHEWNLTCPGRAANGQRHFWSRSPVTNERYKFGWGSLTAWSGIYIEEHEVVGA